MDRLRPDGWRKRLKFRIFLEPLVRLYIRRCEPPTSLTNFYLRWFTSICRNVPSVSTNSFQSGQIAVAGDILREGSHVLPNEADHWGSKESPALRNINQPFQKQRLQKNDVGVRQIHPMAVCSP